MESDGLDITFYDELAFETPTVNFNVKFSVAPFNV